MKIILTLADSDFPQVRVTYGEKGITLEYGRRLTDETFEADLTETLAFADYPELAGINDGTSWNLTELYCLFDWHGHHITLKERLRRLLRQQNPRRGLTDPETRRVYDYVADYIERVGWAPTVREIARACYMSHATVLKHLSLLEAWEYIRRDPEKVRAMCLVE